MTRSTNAIWSELKPEIDKRLMVLASSPHGNEAERLKDFCELAESFLSGKRVGSRGNLAGMLYGEIHYNSLLSTPEIERLAYEFANAAETEDPSSKESI